MVSSIRLSVSASVPTRNFSAPSMSDCVVVLPVFVSSLAIFLSNGLPVYCETPSFDKMVVSLSANISMFVVNDSSISDMATFEPFTRARLYSFENRLLTRCMFDSTVRPQEVLGKLVQKQDPIHSRWRLTFAISRSHLEKKKSNTGETIYGVSNNIEDIDSIINKELCKYIKI